MSKIGVQSLNWKAYPCILAKGQRRSRRHSKAAIAFRKHYGHYPKHNCCHHCDMPTCIQPYHLFDGTQSENMQDMWNKNRRKRKRKLVSTKQLTHLASLVKP